MADWKIGDTALTTRHSYIAGKEKVGLTKVQVMEVLEIVHGFSLDGSTTREMAETWNEKHGYEGVFVDAAGSAFNGTLYHVHGSFFWAFRKANELYPLDKGEQQSLPLEKEDV